MGHIFISIVPTMLNIAVKEIQQTAGQTAVVLQNVCDRSAGLTAGFAG